MFSLQKGGHFFMIKFEVIQELNPNGEILEIIKKYDIE